MNSSGRVAELGSDREQGFCQKSLIAEKVTMIAFKAVPFIAGVPEKISAEDKNRYTEWENEIEDDS